MCLFNKISALLAHTNKRSVLWLVSVLLLVGCNEQELYSDLSERQANDMVAVLYSAGLTATKQRSNDGKFIVLTEQGHFADAVNVLHANGMPQANYQNMGEVFAKEGFVSSPLEERARLNHAMSQEIAHTISSIDGVLMARVHLAVPKQNPLSEEVHAASASVFVKHRTDMDLTDSVARIKALVVNGIENLPYDNVTVALFESEASMVPQRAQVQAPVRSMGLSFGAMNIPMNHRLTVLSLALFVAALALFGLSIKFRHHQAKKQVLRKRMSES